MTDTNLSTLHAFENTIAEFEKHLNTLQILLAHYSGDLVELSREEKTNLLKQMRRYDDAFGIFLESFLTTWGNSLNTLEQCCQTARAGQE